MADFFLENFILYLFLTHLIAVFVFLQSFFMHSRMLLYDVCNRFFLPDVFWILSRSNSVFFSYNSIDMITKGGLGHCPIMKNSSATLVANWSVLVCCMNFLICIGVIGNFHGKKIGMPMEWMGMIFLLT